MLEVLLLNPLQVGYFLLGVWLVFLLDKLDCVVEFQAKSTSELIVNLLVLVPDDVVDAYYILVIYLLFLGLDIVLQDFRNFLGELRKLLVNEGPRDEGEVVALLLGRLFVKVNRVEVERSVQAILLTDGYTEAFLHRLKSDLPHV